VTDPQEKSSLIISFLDSNNSSYINYTIFMLGELLREEIVDEIYLKRLFVKPIIDKLIYNLKLSPFQEQINDFSNKSNYKLKIISILINLAFYEILKMKDLDNRQIELIEELLIKESDFVLIDNIFLFLGNLYEHNDYLNANEIRIYKFTIQFVEKCLENRTSQLDNSNIVTIGILFMCTYFRLIEKVFLTNKSIMNSFKFLTYYFNSDNELTSKNVLIGLYHLIEKSDDLDVNPMLYLEFINKLFRYGYNDNKLVFYILGIFTNICAFESKEIVKKLIDFGLLIFLNKLLINKDNQSYLPNILRVLSNVCSNSHEDALVMYEQGLFPKIINFCISETDKYVLIECIYILSTTCHHNDLNLNRCLVDMGILTAFNHCLKNNVGNDEIELILLGIICIFNSSRNQNNSLNNHFVLMFLDLNGLDQLERLLYNNNNNLSRIAEYIIDKFYNIEVEKFEVDINTEDQIILNN